MWADRGTGAARRDRGRRQECGPDQPTSPSPTGDPAAGLPRAPRGPADPPRPLFALLGEVGVPAAAARRAAIRQRAIGQTDRLSVGLRIADFGDVLGQLRQGDLCVQRRHEVLVQWPQGIQVSHRFQIYRDLVIVLGEALERFG